MFFKLIPVINLTLHQHFHSVPLYLFLVDILPPNSYVTVSFIMIISCPLKHNALNPCKIDENRDKDIFRDRHLLPRPLYC